MPSVLFVCQHHAHPAISAKFFILQTLNRF